MFKGWKGSNKGNVFFSYFLRFRSQDGKIPKLTYVSKLRSSIKNQLIEVHGLDLSNKEYCPEFNDRWLDIVNNLYADDMACNECGQHFTDVGILQVHIENHKPSKPSKESLVSCAKCGLGFSKAWRLKTHIEMLVC